MQHPHALFVNFQISSKSLNIPSNSFQYFSMLYACSINTAKDFVKTLGSFSILHLNERGFLVTGDVTCDFSDAARDNFGQKQTA